VLYCEFLYFFQNSVFCAEFRGILRISPTSQHGIQKNSADFRKSELTIKSSGIRGVVKTRFRGHPAT
jgi:hypothetical protein